MNRKEWESMRDEEQTDSLWELFAGLVLGLFAVWLILFAFPANAKASTDCQEWATMTQVLVLRWQGDKTFEGKTNTDVKIQLEKAMKGNPELDKAKGYVDYAYQHRKDNPVHVWKAVYGKCSAISI